MNTFEYPVILEEQNEGGFVVTFPDIPEAVTQGEEEDEALLYAVDALEAALSLYINDKQSLPTPSTPTADQYTVRPSTLKCGKLGVYQAMVEQGIKKSELARRLGWHLHQVDRLFDLKRVVRFEHIEAAARVLGRQIEVQVKN